MNKSVNIQRGNNAYSTFGGTRCNFHSLDFGQLVPCMCDEVLPRDRWRFQIKNSLEVAPLAVKTRNDVFYNQSAFFVSGGQLDKSYNDIMTGKLTRLGAQVPFLYTFNYLHMLNEILKDIHWDWKKTSYVIENITKSSSYRGLIEIPASGTSFTYSIGPASDYNELLGLVKEYAQQNGKDINIVIMFKAGSTLRAIFVPLAFTKKGQALRKIFDGLGYKMPLIVADHTDDSTNPLPASFVGKEPAFYFSNEVSSSYDFHVPEGMPCTIFANAYPLLAYIKVINDFFVMSSVQDDNPIALFLDAIYNRDSSYIESGYIQTEPIRCDVILNTLLQVSLQLHSDDITRMTRNFYDNNNPFYTTTSSVSNDFEPYPACGRMYETTQPSAVMLNGNSNTIPYNAVLDYAATYKTGPEDIIDNTNYYSYYTNKLLDATHRMLLTAKFAGSKVTSRLRTFFGVSDPIEDAKHSQRVIANVMPLQINGVLINSNTYNGSDVDDDAGTKIATANGGGTTAFTFTNGRDHGYGIVLHWLSVRTVYSNRTPRFILKNHLMDFYNGVYDGQGFSQSVGQMEVNTDNTDPSRHYAFGAEPLFEDYRSLSVDFMSGDVYRVKGLRSYLIPRDFRNILNASELYAEFSAIRSVRQATDEFGDMWIAKDGYDPILVFQDVNVMATRNVQDSVHALGIPSGDVNIEIQHNMA